MKKKTFIKEKLEEKKSPKILRLEHGFSALTPKQNSDPNPNLYDQRDKTPSNRNLLSS